MLSLTTILSISMLVLCSRLPESSDFGGRNTKTNRILVEGGGDASPPQIIEFEVKF